MDSKNSLSQRATPARRRWPLWFGAMLLILITLASFAYLQRVVFFIDAANAALQPYGLHIETVAGLQLTTTSLQISELTLLHSASDASQTLSDIDIGFTLAGLISGRVNTITIAVAKLNIPDTLAGNTPGFAQVPDLPAAINSEPPATATGASATNILDAIPFNQLQIAQLVIAVNEISTGAVRIQNLSADLLSVQVSCQHSRCQLSSELDMSINTVELRSNIRHVELELITLQTHAPINATLEANTNTLSLATRSSTLTLPSIRTGETLTGLTSDIHRINLSQTLGQNSFDLAELDVHAELSVRELYTNLVDINLWSWQMDQQLTWQRGTLSASGTLADGSQRLLLNDLQHHMASGTGQGTLEIPQIEFNDSTQKLSDLLAPIPLQADVLSGSVNANARLSWLTGGDSPPAVSGEGRIHLNDISGYVNEIAFLRLSTDFAAELLPTWQLRSSSAASLDLASLDAGIEFSNIRSDYRVDSEAGSITLTDTSFKVFGGTVSSDQLEYHLHDNDSRFTVVIDSIDLNQVLGMSAYRGVSASGLVSGEIPVRLQGLTPSISGGTLNALQPGGIIRYSSGDSAAGNPSSVGNQSLDLVYQALEDYRFHLMETRVDYQESGELDLAIRMEGVSPELNGGQRINLNLNINDDVPALLQSLQAARSVTDSIQSRLDARQGEVDSTTP